MQNIDQTTFDQISPDLKRYALRLTRNEAHAEDLLQDTYISMLTRKGRTPVRKEGPYMMSIMHNIFIDQIRRTKPEKQPVPLEDVEPVAGDASQTLKITCQEAIAAMDDLPHDLREVLVRHACQGQSYSDIARELSIPMGTVMSRIARARAALCQVLGMEAVTLLEDS